MSKEIHTYLGIATARDGNTQNYPSGERHAFNLFLPQAIGSEASLDEAQEVLENESWAVVEFRKTGLLSEENVRSAGEPFISMYKSAMENDPALLIYREQES